MDDPDPRRELLDVFTPRAAAGGAVGGGSSRTLRGAVAGLLVVAGPWPGIALGAGTPANTPISNTASASYIDSAGQPRTATSNTVTVVVDELLDVAVADGGNVPVLTPDTDRALGFTVTNTGNGSEAFRLAYEDVSGDQFDPQDPGNSPRLFLESDGLAGFTVGDTLYAPGTNDPVLARDGQQVVYFVSNIPSGRSDGDLGSIRLRATAVTAGPTGDPPGTSFPGQGEGGTNAVVGASTASATDQASYVVTDVVASLTKDQSVADPFGGTRPVPGAIITYTLTFQLSGTGSVTLARIVDDIPANSAYVAGSLTLNAASLSDAADGDAGRFLSTPAPRGSIEVQLASPLAAPSTQIVTFQVRIN